ncbi:MAG TPA: glycosyltransferase [Paracoccaceae bacterium]|nr:glycosyltransferase [Paracoccaceae bacterium]
MTLVAASLLAFLSSLILSLLIVLTQSVHGRFTLDGHLGVQKVHRHPTPRVGGLTLAGGCVAGGLVLPIEAAAFSTALYAAAMPAFLSGLMEDLTKRVGAALRLLATIIAGGIFVQATGYAITEVDLPLADQLLAIPGFAFLFTAFAIGGIANAINIVDGVNGLAAGTAVIVLAAFGLIAGAVGDATILAACVVGLSALCGFMALNFPGGRLFMGDAGAYGTGFALAAIAVALPQRNAEVSPLIGLLLLAYPVAETMVSIRRRMVRDGAHPGQPDRLHLHSLVYRSQARRLADLLSRPHLRNPLTAVLIWWLPLLSAGLALLTWRNSGLVLTAVTVVTVGYLLHYRRVALLRRGGILRDATA